MKHLFVSVGLNGGVGKTTVLYRLKDGTTVDCMHTVGFNLETVQHNNMTMDVWDIGGGDKITALWNQYFPDTKSVIFVIDSTDKERVEQVEFELNRLVIKIFVHQKIFSRKVFEINCSSHSISSLISLKFTVVAISVSKWQSRS